MENILQLWLTMEPWVGFLNQPWQTLRLTRWIIKLQSFSVRVQYRKGQCNVQLRQKKQGDSPAVLKTLTDVSWSIPGDWDNLQEHQLFDISLTPLWGEAQKPTNASHIHYAMHNQCLYRAIPNKRGGRQMQHCLQYTYANPLSGHLGHTNPFQLIW